MPRTQIFVKTMYGKTVTAEAAASDTVLDLKLLLQEKENIAADDQRLVYRSCQLEDSRPLGACVPSYDEVPGSADGMTCDEAREQARDKSWAVPLPSIQALTAGKWAKRRALRRVLQQQQRAREESRKLCDSYAEVLGGNAHDVKWEGIPKASTVYLVTRVDGATRRRGVCCLEACEAISDLHDRVCEYVGWKSRTEALRRRIHAAAKDNVFYEAMAEHYGRLLLERGGGAVVIKGLAVSRG